jgi:DNA repair protein SbcD/Mre11
MKLLHAADLHLDSPMRGLARYEEAPVDELRMATRAALANLVEVAIAESVDAVLLAGDIYDGDWPHFGTGLHFAKEMGRLREAEIPVVMISGNHDAESKLTKAVHLPDNVTVLGTREPQTKAFEDLGLAVHGQGYATPEVLEDLSAAYPDPLADMVNIGLLHTAAEGRPGHAPYAPCKVERLAQHGYQAWALGHVHAREVLHLDPLVIFPGNLQGRNIRESGPKGATLIEIDEGGELTHTDLDLDHVRWALVEVDATAATGRDEVLGSIAAALREASLGADGRLLAAGIVITGESAAHQSLAGDAERLRYDAISAAVGVLGDRVFIERVALRSRPISRMTCGADAVGELIAEIDAIEVGEEGVGGLLEELGQLELVLPKEARGDFDPADPAAVRALLGEVRVSLPARLLQGAED